MLQAATEAILALLSTSTIQTYYPKVNTMKYPVKVTYRNSNDIDFKMLTLEEANQKFIVVKGLLVEQEVNAMSEEVVISRLAYSEDCLMDAIKDLDCMSADFRIRVQKRIASLGVDIAVLKQAVSFFKQLKGE